MGCALSSAEKEAVQRSLAIDKTLASESATKKDEIKLLLLGKPVDLCMHAKGISICLQLYSISIVSCDQFRQLPLLCAYVRVSLFQVASSKITLFMIDLGALHRRGVALQDLGVQNYVDCSAESISRSTLQQSVCSQASQLASSTASNVYVHCTFRDQSTSLATQYTQ